MEIVSNNLDSILNQPHCNTSPLLSPVSKSRYGRVQKPKINEDFYNLGEAITEKSKRRSSKSPLKSPKMLNKSPLKQLRSQTQKHLIKSDNYDDNNVKNKDLELNLSQPFEDKLLEHDELAFKIKQEEIMECEEELMNSQSKIDSSNSSDSGIKDEDEIILFIDEKSTKPILVKDDDDDEDEDIKNKTAKRTYKNKRRSYLQDEKNNVLESFGLPDEPMFMEKSINQSEIEDKIKDKDVDDNVIKSDEKNNYKMEENAAIKAAEKNSDKTEEGLLQFNPDLVIKKVEQKDNDAVIKTPDKTVEDAATKAAEKNNDNTVKEVFQFNPDLVNKKLKKDKAAEKNNDKTDGDAARKSAEKNNAKTGGEELVQFNPDLVIKKELLEEEFVPMEEETDDPTDFLKNISIKTEPELKLEPNFENASFNTNIEFNVGDLVWAKMGCFPYWPAMITADPETNQHYKWVQKRQYMLLYHINFFGDRGRWAWIYRASLIPYKENEKLDYLNVVKGKKKIRITQNNLVKLNDSLSEIVCFADKSLEEKLEHFSKYTQKKKKKDKDKKLKVQPKIEVKEEPMDYESIDETDTSQDTQKSGIGIKKFTKQRNSLHKKLIKDDEENLSSETETQVKSKPKGIRLSKRITKSPVKKLIKEESCDSDSVSDVVVEVKRGRGRPPKKLSNLLLDIRQDDISENSSEVELNFTTSYEQEEYTMESQNALYKRCNFFRGLTKEKICQVCRKPEDILKCRGCNGYFHQDCANKTLEELEVIMQKTDDNDNNKNKTVKNSQNNKNEDTNLTNANLSISDQIDLKMKEIMEQLDMDVYGGESSDSDEDASVDYSLFMGNKQIKHVTADSVIYSEEILKKVFKCINCENDEDHLCFVCHKIVSPKGSSIRQKCSLPRCGKYYHPACLKTWPQTQWSSNTTTKHKDSAEQLSLFVCPMHHCHICISDDPRAAISRTPTDKIVKCLKCPASYHSQPFCIPAGSEILTSSQIICPRHVKNKKTINTIWCHICSEGGDIVCCETCPTSVHSSCLDINLMEDGTFICEDCETGRLPLYDEVVWAKIGTFRWWPALILYPQEVPQNVNKQPHKRGDFVVKFFGTNDYAWISRGKVFLFQEGDSDTNKQAKGQRDVDYQRAVLEAAKAYTFKTEFRNKKNAEKKVNDLKPPHYIKIKSNKPVKNVRLFDGDESNTTSCDCNPNLPNPCGPDSRCLNRLLLTECNPEVCPAGQKCQNQRFEKRLYPPLTPYRTDGRGWGLKTLSDLVKGQFVIEYVGEVIDEQEYQRRIKQMHENKEENYYFLTIDNQRMIDAGPKGNVARFMNHSCQPNTETQKWTINGETRVGLFALKDIPADSELTFNYNLEVVGEEKKVCRCGASNCSGFIGLKTKQEDTTKKLRMNIKKRKWKRKKSIQHTAAVVCEPCFICGKDGETNHCQNKICTKAYHLECVKLDSWPEGKWVCPWHNCNICTKRTIRCCVKCTNSYCPTHSDGFVRYDKLLGFVCNEHDPININAVEVQNSADNKKLIPRTENISISTKETDVTSTTQDDMEFACEEARIVSEIMQEALSTPTSDMTVSSSPMKNDNRQEKHKKERKRKRYMKSRESPRKRAKTEEFENSITKDDDEEEEAHQKNDNNIVQSSTNNVVISENQIPKSISISNNNLLTMQEMVEEKVEVEKEKPTTRRTSGRIRTKL